MDSADKIKSLRQFFRVTNAAFECVNHMSTAITGKKRKYDNPMETLHRLALVEVEKENPDMFYLNNIMRQLELIAEENKQDNEQP